MQSELGVVVDLHLFSDLLFIYVPNIWRTGGTEVRTALLDKRAAPPVYVVNTTSSTFQRKRIAKFGVY
jgi:hypothetical protein